MRRSGECSVRMLVVLPVLLAASRCGGDAGATVDAAAPLRDGHLGITDTADGGADPTPARYRAVVSTVEAQMAREGIPGASLAILEGGRLVFATGIGVKRVGDPAPVTTRTLYRVGGMTSMVTAAAVLALEDEGALQVEHSIEESVPSVQLAEGAVTGSVTIEHLLSHTSGLPTEAPFTCSESLSAYWQNHQPPLWTVPGAVWGYSNLGLSLAGFVAEIAAGEPYADVVRRRILQPAGMNDATFDPGVAAVGDFATGHGDGGRTQYDPTSYDCPYMAPAGFLFATATDFARFAEMLLAGGGDVLSTASAHAMLTPRVDTNTLAGLHYALGLEVLLSADASESERHFASAFSHSGSMPGFSARLVVLPQLQTGVVLLLNGSADVAMITARALDALLGRMSQPSAHFAAPPRHATEHAGAYGFAATGDIGVKLRGTAPHVGLAIGTETHGGLVRQNANDHFESGNNALLADAATFRSGRSTGRPLWVAAPLARGERLQEAQP